MKIFTLIIEISKSIPHSLTLMLKLPWCIMNLVKRQCKWLT